jgi:hypothetical protein
MAGVKIPVEKPALMHELYGSQNIFQDLFRGEGYLVEGVLVHLESHQVVGHWFVEVV